MFFEGCILFRFKIFTPFKWFRVCSPGAWPGVVDPALPRPHGQGEEPGGGDTEDQRAPVLQPEVSHREEDGHVPWIQGE